MIKPKKERNYRNFRQLTGAPEHALLKKMVNQELDIEKQALLDLAERVGYLDPSRAESRKMSPNSPFKDSRQDLFQNK